MTRRMTNDEAVDLLEAVFEVSPESEAIGLVEGFAIDIDVSQAQADIDSFLALRPGDIDPESIEIHPDHCDEADLAAVRIVVKTEG